MDYQKPAMHYEQVYIKHLDGHRGDSSSEDPDAADNDGTGDCFLILISVKHLDGLVSEEFNEDYDEILPGSTVGGPDYVSGDKIIQKKC